MKKTDNFHLHCLLLLRALGWRDFSHFFIIPSCAYGAVPSSRRTHSMWRFAGYRSLRCPAFFLLCMLCHCRLTKNSFTEPYYMGCGMPKGIRSCAPQIFALHQFSKHHRVGSHLFLKNVKELIAFQTLSRRGGAQ